MRPFSKEAYQLFQDGILALADVEMTGIRVNTKYLSCQIEELSDQITAAERIIWRSSEAKEWKRKFKSKTNIGSIAQLSSLLFKTLNYKPTKVTIKGNATVDNEVLLHIGTPFTKAILAKRKLSKVRDTYLTRILNEQVDGIFHPTYNLHTTVTYRSSSDFQNIPVRDPEQGQVIRRAIIPHLPTDIIGEIDYKGNEVTSNVCYNQDPNLINYLEDPNEDMHRDSARDCFLLKPKQIGKMIRYVGKNGFTFPEFYGSYYENVAPAMWQAIAEHNLKTEDGIPLKQHLKSKGIEKRGVMIEDETTGKRYAEPHTFLAHIQQVEQHFWNERFPTFAQWKLDWHKMYLRKGYFDLLTGFRCQGPMRKTEVCNYPGQGTAFHFLLWDLIQIHQWLKTNEMRTSIIGQIHDSIIFNFHPAEVETVVRKARKIMTQDIRKHWPWINVPIVVDVELAPAGKSWYDKRKVTIT